MIKPSKPKKTPPYFSICLQCNPCGGSCSFLDNNVIFVRNKKTNKVTQLAFDTSMAACNGQCGYDCVTKFKLRKTL